MKLFAFLFCMIMFLPNTFASAARQGDITHLPETCSPGWLRDGQTKQYTAKNLYEYINGEAELYLPYGFKQLATAFYGESGTKAAGLVVNVFAMGSLLDAFGIYANYRSALAEQINVGAEGFADESQIMFYQDHYFVQITGSGNPTPDRSAFLTCGAAISKRLPPSGRPTELRFLDIPGIAKGSEKYYPEGLLGYKFLGKGLTAEVPTKAGLLKAIVILGDSGKTIERSLKEYRRYLAKSDPNAKLTGGQKALALHGADPLYKGVLFQQSARYAAGVTGLSDANKIEGEAILRQLMKRLP